jgi:peroxiredoxin
MLSPRRAAQLGLSAAVLVAVACLALLAAGAAEDRRLLIGQPGATAPDFVLPDAMNPSGTPIHLADLRGSVVVLYFSSIRCPVNNDYDQRIAQLASRHEKRGRVKFLAIHSASAAQSPLEISVQSSVAGLRFPHLLDTDGAVAARYAAQMTPTFIVIDRSGEIRYRGAFDDSRAIEGVRRQYLENAIYDVLSGRPIGEQTSEVSGCAIR